MLPFSCISMVSLPHSCARGFFGYSAYGDIWKSPLLKMSLLMSFLFFRQQVTISAMPMISRSPPPAAAITTVMSWYGFPQLNPPKPKGQLTQVSFSSLYPSSQALQEWSILLYLKYPLLHWQSATPSKSVHSEVSLSHSGSFCLHKLPTLWSGFKLEIKWQESGGDLQARM